MSDFLEFSSIDAYLLALSDIPVDPGEPPCYFPALQHLFHYHIPFKYLVKNARKDILFRNRYNNHRDYNSYLSSIHEKLATNTQK